ncbi:DNA polymerase III subunit gamma/tau [Cohnella candidum]|uniref:DNA-directed DNA polymerase n=1 Tax=Cohnella candidum TaxID=2674991 RepID=A0A3G3K2M2_9BACL|nr:DNA polymerase III subunit gamma/tau [Cohnella candidum]AYQ74713.1 DNA polymerase III subunit gamma/tau [Cohnella candidum]
MAHLALYRAWRPQTFQDMVGQQHIVQTLQNAIRENRLSHAYLFSGPRGTGKTTAAKVLAKAVNCERGPSQEPCNECPSCVRITAGTVMDVVEIDAASNRGVEEIRDIRDKVKYAPTEVRRKVYIIDEVHMLTTEAFNALLKTLEEPPAHVMFILATTESHKLPATIISRCQRFEFRRVPLEEQTARLREIAEQEGMNAEDPALAYIARLSDGGMRDAVSLLDQIASFAGGNVTLEQAIDATGGLPSEQFARLATAVRDGDVSAVLQEIDDMMKAGKSADKCLEQLMHYFRDMLLAQLAPDASSSSGRVADPSDLRQLAAGFPREKLFGIIDTLNRYQTEMKYAAHPQTMFEIALIKLCTASGETPSVQEGSAAGASAGGAQAGVSSGEVSKLQARLADMERKLEAALKGGGVAGGSTSGASASGGGRSSGVSQAPSKAPRVRVKLDPFVAAHDSPQSKELTAKWPQVLQRVKEERVTVHAWLVDGEPAAYADGTVLVAFRNTIHRETTERPANKAMIEGVLTSVLGKPAEMVTTMQKDWQEALASGAGASREEAAAGEELRLVPEDGTEPAREPIIEEALRLFGEELVVIKDD